MATRHNRWCSLAVALALLLALPAPAVSSATEPEDELKAATVLTFLRYTQWAQTNATGPITIGVLGRPAMAATLRRMLEGKSVNNRTIQVLDARAGTELAACSVAYLATENATELRQALAHLRTSHALVMGEAKRFLDEGGAVNLMIVEGHMSFEVSMEALDRAGVSVSSKLLRYGQVKARPPA
jgi:hypothetical protein